MKYKVGDKVKIKSLDWYKANKNKKGNTTFYRNSTYTMSYYCGKIAKIINVKDKSYSINLDNGLYSWTDEMFEENINDSLHRIFGIILMLNIPIYSISHHISLSCSDK